MYWARCAPSAHSRRWCASLGDPEDEVRAKAATALGRLGDRRAIGYLLEHLLTDPAPFVRARIAGALGQFGGPEVIDRLVRALGDPAWWVRMRSVEALEQIGSVAEGPLLVALDDPDPEIRVRAAVALERLGVPDNLVRMIESGERVARGVRHPREVCHLRDARVPGRAGPASLAPGTRSGGHGGPAG